MEMVCRIKDLDRKKETARRSNDRGSLFEFKRWFTPTAF